MLDYLAKGTQVSAITDGMVESLKREWCVGSVREAVDKGMHRNPH